MNVVGAKSFRDIVESKIRKKSSGVNKDESMARLIYTLLRKLKGHSLNDVLQMSMPQFYCLIECIYDDFEKEKKAHEKAKRRRK